MTDSNGLYPTGIAAGGAKDPTLSTIINLEKKTSNKKGTVSSGIGLSGTLVIWCGSVQIGTSIDTKGNVACQGIISGGVTGTEKPGIAATKYVTVTNAPNINKLIGTGYNIGVASAGGGAIGGMDFNIIPDSNINKPYYGMTGSGGIGTPGIDAHVMWGETYQIGMSFNLYDYLYRKYITIMGD